MKKLIIAALAVAAVAGCQKQGNVVEEQGTPIIVKAGFSVTADTKAINAEGTGFVQGEDVFRIWAYDGVDAPANLYDNIANHKVDMKANNEFHLNEPKFYPVNGNKLYFYAYAPAANTVSQGTGLADATATFTLNGSQDIIYANDVTGYDKTGDAQPDLEFNHKMTCIEFHVIADENFGDGMLLKNISILSQPNQGVMNVVDGDINFSGSTTYSNAIADVEIDFRQEAEKTFFFVFGTALLVAVTGSVPAIVCLPCVCPFRHLRQHFLADIPGAEQILVGLLIVGIMKKVDVSYLVERVCIKVLVVRGCPGIVTGGHHVEVGEGRIRVGVDMFPACLCQIG